MIVAFLYCYCLLFVLLLHFVVMFGVCFIVAFGCYCYGLVLVLLCGQLCCWLLFFGVCFLYYCMFMVCFVYYLLLLLLVLFARNVGPGWMPPPRWGVYGMPMPEAWVAFLPSGSPYTRSSELFSSQAHGYLFLWSFAFFLLLLIML